MQNSIVKKSAKVILWMLVALIVLCGLLQLSFVFYFNGKIRADLQKEFSDQTKGEYELQIRKIQANIFLQSVFVGDFNVRPVKGIHKEASKYFLSAEELNLENFNFISFLRTRELKFYRLELEGPSATVFRNDIDVVHDEADHGNHEAFSIYRLIKKHMRSLSIENINVHNAEIKIYDNDRDSLLIINSKNNELNIEGLRIDEQADRLGRLFLAEKTDLAILGFSYTTQDSLYTVSIAKVFASYSDSTVYMDSVRLTPNYSKREFARRAGEQTDRLKLSASKVEFSGMDVKLFFEKNWFVARQLQIDKFRLEAYRDKNDTRKEHIPRSVQALVKSVPIEMKIDKMIVKNAACAYEEVAVNADKPGKIDFSDIDAHITGLSNRPGNVNNSVIVVNASCRVMNKGRLKVKYVFPLNTDAMVFNCSGRLSEMPFTEMNKVLEPIAKVSAAEGEIDSMMFSFRANDRFADGEMKLIYHGLKIQILTKKDHKRDPVEHFLSFMAHALVIKEQNPTRNQPPRITRIYYERDPHRFLFNYSLKALLSGIKPAIGLPNKKRENKGL